MRAALPLVAAFAALAAVFFQAVPARAVEIAKVRADHVRFDPAKGESLAVAFRLTAPARVELRLYDGRELRILRIESAGELPAGDHTLRWDGRDEAGRPVPPEAYHGSPRCDAPAEACPLARPGAPSPRCGAC